MCSCNLFVFRVCLIYFLFVGNIVEHNFIAVYWRYLNMFIHRIFTKTINTCMYYFSKNIIFWRRKDLRTFSIFLNTLCGHFQFRYSAESSFAQTALIIFCLASRFYGCFQVHRTNNVSIGLVSSDSNTLLSSNHSKSLVLR